MIRNIIEEIRTYPGITRKNTIYRITNGLKSAVDFGYTIADFGEDAAAISFQGQYLLLAADGIWPGLIQANPYAAGKAAVMASVNDIYAMGGRPLAMVNVIGLPDGRYYDDIVRGIAKGCMKYRVPMVGGHLHPDTSELSLSVAIMGVAKNLLLSTNAFPGQHIIFVVDLVGRGYQCKPVISWDTNSGKSSEQVLKRLEVLPVLAEQGICSTAKDISNGGLLGTIALLLETSEVGAIITLDNIPRPQEFSIIDWLKAFLSFGFILCVDPAYSQCVIQRFNHVGVTACIIGKVTADRKMLVSYQKQTDILFDFEKETITGISPIDSYVTSG
ncbi:MAG: AIR synthase related protein [Desulfobacterota bacterium]|nr:AIR synthase related protein [Thermodesulfobacteriota bacterium]